MGNADRSPSEQVGKQAEERCRGAVGTVWLGGEESGGGRTAGDGAGPRRSRPTRPDASLVKRSEKLLVR